MYALHFAILLSLHSRSVRHNLLLIEHEQPNAANFQVNA
jgi:hypothetical protein